MTEETVSTEELMGGRISRAQVSFWMKQGYIAPCGGGGHGYPLRWDIRTLLLARHMIRLIEAGFTPQSAYILGVDAREHFESNPNAKVWMADEVGGVIVGLRRV